MAKRAGGVIPWIEIDPNSPDPLYAQIEDGLRDAILSRRLRPGTRLPSTRSLARDLDVSRSTVLEAYRRLDAHGYLVSREGAGTFVASRVPEEAMQTPTPATTRRDDDRPERLVPSLSRRGKRLSAAGASLALGRDIAPLHPGTASTSEFPFQNWGRILRRQQDRLADGSLRYPGPAGYAPLRYAIADYLSATRGLRCDGSQVMITTGAQQSLCLAAQALLDPGDPIWHEDPGYLSARNAFVGAGAEVVPVPVDDEGIDVDVGRRRAPSARVAYTSPSHQFPLGVTMSLGRRLALLDWAEEADAWILEDDYDSEYRFQNRPVQALQGIDRYGRVLYIGTFAKILHPVAGIGYVVLPPELEDSFVHLRTVLEGRMMFEGQPSILTQTVLAEFIAEGHLTRHIRRIRTLYGRRYRTLVEATEEELGEILDVAPTDAGITLVAWLPDGTDDLELSHRLVAAGVLACPLSSFYLEEPRRPGLMFGFAPFTEEEIRRAVRRAALVLRRQGVAA